MQTKTNSTKVRKWFMLENGFSSHQTQGEIKQGVSPLVQFHAKLILFFIV